MALLGTAALAMWWDITAGVVDEFQDWHSHEHFVERLGIPGFERASRWKSEQSATGFFVMYELRDHDVLASPDYLRSLNAPSPWSTKMMPHHLGMIRSQCRVLESRGGAVAGHALTVRLSPVQGREGELRRYLDGVVERLAAHPGCAGAHLLRHERPAIAQTTEQKIRGGDREADWVIAVMSYDAAALVTAIDRDVADDSLAAAGAAPGWQLGRYTLAHSATPRDTA